MDPITIADIEEAERRIRAHVRPTPLKAAASRPGLHLKLESLQRTGSFKLRGALNAVLAADDAELRDGVSAISAGNHGLGVAFAARQRKVAARIYVPPGAVAFKVDAMRALGAEVVEQPVSVLGEMMVAADTRDGRLFISPFANRHVAAGQGTVGLEILAELPEPSLVLLPIGGGGLALGVATALRARSPRTRLVGVVAEGAPAFRNAWTTGKADLVKSTSIADGLCAPIADVAVTRQLKGLLDELAVVQDPDILAAMRGLALDDKVVAEPAGAATMAAALKRGDLGPRAVAVVSGGNVRPELLAEVVARR